MLTIKQAAEHLGVSAQTIRRLCDSGLIPFYRPTGPMGHRRFKRSELESYVAKVREAPKAEPPQIEIKRDSFGGSCADVIARLKARRAK